MQATTGKLRTYKLIKQDLKLEKYLELPPHLRVPVTRLRTSAHPLRIETGRYNLPTALPVEERTCWFCSNSAVEDETHFLFSCQLYAQMQEFKDLLVYCNTLNSAFSYLDRLDKWKFISATTDNYLYAKFVSRRTNLWCFVTS